MSLQSLHLIISISFIDANVQLSFTFRLKVTSKEIVEGIPSCKHYNVLLPTTVIPPDSTKDAISLMFQQKLCFIRKGNHQ